MHGVDPEILLIYRLLDLTGVFLNGILGGTMARQRRFDAIGFIFLALLTALGGGMIRDALIGHGSAAAVSNPSYILLALAGAFVAFIAQLEGRQWRLFSLYGDAITLGCWAVTGASKALANDLPWPSAVFLGLLTAVGGGMLRDVVVGRTPIIFGGGPLYASPAILSALLFVIFDSCGFEALGMILAPIPGIVLTIVAHLRGWSLPQTKDWAPLNLTASQLRNALRYADKYGFKAAWKRAEERQWRLGRPPRE